MHLDQLVGHQLHRTHGPVDQLRNTDTDTDSGTVTATFHNDGSWPTTSAAVSYVHFQLPAGETLNSAASDTDATTCTWTTSKKGRPAYTATATGIDVNTISCADEAVLVLDTTIMSGSTITPGTLTDGIVMQYRTTDPRNNKSSLWRNTGNYYIVAFPIGYAVLQWPKTIDQVITATFTTVYGQVFVAGLTDSSGDPSLTTAQVGFGAPETELPISTSIRDDESERPHRVYRIDQSAD